MNDHRYFGVSLRFVTLDGSDSWTITIDQDGTPANARPARFISGGPINRFLLHDILKVLDTRVESALIRQVGLQTSLADIVEFPATTPHGA